MTLRPDAPGPLRRRGPRPLLLHLMLATLRSGASLTVSPSSSSAWPASSMAFAQAAQRIARSVQAASGASAPDPGSPRSAPNLGAAETDFAAAVWREALAQDRALLAGIAAYRRHPFQRVLADPPCRWQEGDARLLDFAPGAPPSSPAALLVPSLVNRAHVLDLAPGHSLLRFLAASGVRPLLLDWGWPGETERRFTLTDYVAGRLERAIVAGHGLAGGRIALVGYCMGGTLAVAAAQRRPDLLSGLGLLATPWDFHAEAPVSAPRAGTEPGNAERGAWLGRTVALLEPALAFNGTLPVDLLQVLFTLLDPYGVAARYRGFARLDQDSARAHLFVALEDWLNDGVPLSAPVARECLAGWYGANTPGRGVWPIAGLPVDPAALRLPAFVAVPRRDRIVPGESARPLARLIPGAMLHEPAAGHIGMVAGAGAEAALWAPLRDWLLGLPRGPARLPRRRRGV